MAENERFVKVYKQGAVSQYAVIVDRKTGVNYLWHAEGYAAGLAPLLDSDGKPVVTPIDKS